MREKERERWITEEEGGYAFIIYLFIYFFYLQTVRTLRQRQTVEVRSETPASHAGGLKDKQSYW